MIDAAKQLIQLGLPIIPICSHDHQNMSSLHIQRCKCAGKTPLIKGWQTHDNTTEANLQEWIRSFKTFNLGLPLGDASGYCGIDVDGEEGVRLLMEMSNGDLPATWEFSTGAGSRLIYKIPIGIETKKFKQVGKGVHEECALLCTGQQTVIPPSIHNTGRVYEWVKERSPWEIDCALAPQWLIDLIRVDKTATTANTGFTMDLSSDEVVIGDASILDNLDEEFMAEDMQYDIPLNVQVANKNIRVGKTGHKIVVTDEVLTSPIPEGSRDNTMTAIIGHYCANRDLRRFGQDFITNLCLQHNAHYCQPPLDDQAIIDKVNYFMAAEGMKDATFKKNKNDKPQFEASLMASKVIEGLLAKGIHIHFDQFSGMYYYTTSDKGPWFATYNYKLIQKWIRDIITSQECGDTSWDKRNFIEETRMAIEESFTQPYKKESDFDLGAHAKELCDYIVVKNGILNWRDRELTDWDPALKTTIAFEVEYDATATCPRFLKYLQDWLPDADVRAVLQEYLGYCLIPNTNFRKALFLYGKGKNGKSMLVEFLQEFFGDYSSTLSYDGLFTRFGPAELKDKLVNIFDDTTVSFTKETSIVKNLIAGGSISAEHKGKDMFKFINVARLIYSSQETPKTSDNTVAWYDRWFFIKFPNTFRPSNRAKFEIQNALREEKAGIFNWMIEGLERLMKNDDFTGSKALVNTTIDYRSQNDNVTQFVFNLCKATDDSEVSLTDLYKVYNVWVLAEQLRPVSKKVFTQRISDMGYDRVKGYINGKSGQSVFKGLTLNKESEDYMENALEIGVALNGY